IFDGGLNDDTIQAQDGEVDKSIECGDGTADVAFVDTNDPTPSNCETVNMPDTTPPPVPTITVHPPSLSPSTGASFSFVDGDGTASFLCSLDGSAFAACATPKSYAGLGQGTHPFKVEAKDP